MWEGGRVRAKGRVMGVCVHIEGDRREGDGWRKRNLGMCRAEELGFVLRGIVIRNRNKNPDWRSLNGLCIITRSLFSQAAKSGVKPLTMPATFTSAFCSRAFGNVRNNRFPLQLLSHSMVRRFSACSDGA